MRGAAIRVFTTAVRVIQLQEQIFSTNAFIPLTPARTHAQQIQTIVAENVMISVSLNDLKCAHLKSSNCNITDKY